MLINVSIAQMYLFSCWNGYAVYFENTRINDSKFCYLQKFCYASIFTLMYVRKRNKLDIDLTTLHYIHKHYLCHFLYQFSWCSGYHICLTHRRSPVRAWAVSMFLFFKPLLFWLDFHQLKHINVFCITSDSVWPRKVTQSKTIKCKKLIHEDTVV